MSDSTADTLEHIIKVCNCMNIVCIALMRRGMRHDASKLLEPEKSGYDQLVTKLADVPYGTDDYRAALTEAKPTIAHHYAANSHHPEYWPMPQSNEINTLHADIEILKQSISGEEDEAWRIRGAIMRIIVRLEHDLTHLESRVNGMSLLDITEMVCDWKAASERTRQGSIEQSLAHNKERFGLSDQLAAILENTVRELDW